MKFSNYEDVFLYFESFTNLEKGSGIVDRLGNKKNKDLEHIYNKILRNIKINYDPYKIDDGSSIWTLPLTDNTTTVTYSTDTITTNNQNITWKWYYERL